MSKAIKQSSIRQMENEQSIEDLNKLGVQVYDSDGGFRSMIDIINDIAKISDDIKIDTTQLVSGVAKIVTR